MKLSKQIKEDNPKPTNLEHLEQEIEDMITAERDAKTSRDWNL